MEKKSKTALGKDKFKQLKNKKTTVYRVPKFFEKETGVKIVTDSGMVQHPNQIYSKLYKVKNVDATGANINEMLGKLRSMDLDFECIRFFNELWLQVFATYSNINEAQEGFDVIDKEFILCAQCYDIQLELLNLNQRLDFHVHLICKLAENELNIDSYREQIQEWKNVYSLLEFQNYNEEFKVENNKYSFLFVRRFPNKLTDSNSFIQILENTDGIIGILTYYEMVSDQNVAKFIKDRYVGFDGLMSRIKRKNPLMYKVLTASETDSDAQCYVDTTVCCLIKESNEGGSQKIREELTEMLGKYGYYFDFVCFEQKKLLDMFSGFGVNSVKLSRLIPSEHMHHVFPVSTVVEEKEEYDIEAMKKLFLN